MSLQAIKFQDPAYNGGAVSDGFLDTVTGNIIEPGNTNGNTVDSFGWQLAQYQAAAAVMNATLAGQIRGDCAATGITPMSTWEYIGKPLAIMAAAVAGGEFLGAAGAASGAGAGSGAGTLAPTLIAAPAAPIAAAPISLASLAPVSAAFAPISAVGTVAGAGASGGLLSGLGAEAANVGKSAALDVVKGSLLAALPKPKLPTIAPVGPAPAKPTGSMLIWLIFGAAALALGGVF